MTNRNADSGVVLNVRRNQTSILIALLSLVLALEPLAQTVAPSKLIADGARQLEEGRSTLNQVTLLAAKAMFDDCIHNDEKNAACYYDLARTEYYLARERDAAKDKKAANDGSILPSLMLNDPSH